MTNQIDHAPDFALSPDGIDLAPIIEGVLAEARAAEQEMIAKNGELQTARERLAAARGKLELIGQLQQMTARRGMEPTA